ncbi:hypothetical protein [Hymenobacter ruricola]|uniref:DUF3096 domain-containing protein n=1 Tax=Hymenobacter ruricola TaxID=2791023 RepID=A0ABS0HZG3_9BACT|nr:hypothetical protein [Hymenobacter ruricola]MBF9220039.1 hypothetical protein [Hymenobacter ruricola]
MKNPLLSFTKPFTKLAAVACCALALGNCNRAEYAMLPKGASYHGVARAATPVPPAKPAAVASAATTPAAAEVAAAPAPAAAEAAPISEKAPATAAKAAAPQTTTATATTAAGATTATTIASDAPKAKGLTNMLTRKIEKRVSKMLSKAPSADRQSTAETAKSGFSVSIKTGIILMVIGALIALLPGLFRLLGLIVFIVGVLILLLALLDMA